MIGNCANTAQNKIDLPSVLLQFLIAVTAKDGRDVVHVGPIMPFTLAGIRVGSFLRKILGVHLNFSEVVMNRF